MLSIRFPQADSSSIYPAVVEYVSPISFIDGGMARFPFVGYLQSHNISSAMAVVS